MNKTLGKPLLLLVAAFLAFLLVGPVAHAATFKVNSTADAVDVRPGNGVCKSAARNCTLRAAIMEANALPGGPHTIVLPAGTYTLTLFGAGEALAATGDLDIRTGLSIAAIGGQAIVQGAPGWDDRIFQVSAVAEMTGLVIRNGHTATGGGGIFNGGRLTLNGCTVSNNSAGDGGGIFNANGGVLTLIGTTVVGNQANPGTSGGGIYNIGTLTVKNTSHVSSNFAPAGGGGIVNGAIIGGVTFPGTLSLTSSTVEGNKTDGSGGGIRASLGSRTILNAGNVEVNSASTGGGIFNFGVLALSGGSRVSGNSAGATGGGITNGEGATLTLVDSTVDGNRTDGSGGGIFNIGTLATRSATRISGNFALSGGAGIVNSGSSATLTLVDSTVDGNRTDGSGGGIFNLSALVLDGSTVSSNAASHGGGITQSGDRLSRLSLTNSTVSGNSAAVGGGGIAVFEGTTILSNVTVAGNIVPSSASPTLGGGILHSGGTLAFQNTILARNTASQGPDCRTFSSLTSQGFNLIRNVADCAITGVTTGNLLGLDPGLGPLQDNGGPTFTHALLAGSPATDKGNPTAPGSGGVACATTDQRGATRPAQGAGNGSVRCDIGAFEVNPDFLGFAILDPEAVEVPVHERLTFMFTWIVPPTFPGWRAVLDTLQLRIRHAHETIFWLRFDEATDTFSLLNERTGRFGYGLPRTRGRLHTPFATLYLDESEVDGPPGPRVTLTLVVSFKRPVADRTYVVEVLATNGSDQQHRFEEKGELTVVSVHGRPHTPVDEGPDE